MYFKQVKCTLNTASWLDTYIQYKHRVTNPGHCNCIIVMLLIEPLYNSQRVYPTEYWRNSGVWLSCQRPGFDALPFVLKVGWLLWGHRNARPGLVRGAKHTKHRNVLPVCKGQCCVSSVLIHTYWRYAFPFTPATRVRFLVHRSLDMCFFLSNQNHICYSTNSTYPYFECHHWFNWLRNTHDLIKLIT